MRNTFRHHDCQVQDIVSSQQLQGILRSEKLAAMDTFIVSVLVICGIPKFIINFFSQLFGSLHPIFFLSSITSINPFFIMAGPRLRAALKSIVNI